MKRWFPSWLGAIGLALAAAGTAGAADWLTAPSYFTHDPETGRRVRQYAPIGPFYVQADPSYVRSGYRHTRSSIQVGDSADHLHIVEQWGRPVRPYGEWRFPYRPYAVPYPLWGPVVPPAYYGYWPAPYGPGYGSPVPGRGDPSAWGEGRYRKYDRRGHTRFPPPPLPYGWPDGGHDGSSGGEDGA